MAEQHAIDKLALDINVNSSTANVNKIDKLSSVLDKLAGVLYDFPSTTFDRISQNLSQLGNAFNSISASNKNISGLATRISNLNKKMADIDVSTMQTKFSQMASAITPFIDKINSAESSLIALNNVVNGSNKVSTNAIPSVPSSNKASKGFLSFLKLSRWTAIVYAARRLGNLMGDIVQKGSDFGETLNLWQVSMGEKFLPQATEFVDKLNEAYGISKKTLMNSQAIFKNMLGSLGQISEQTAYQLSEGITQMALDYASLYNVQFEDAMTKFQAALAGQVRPIRSVAGYDITENTLYQLYQSLGGTKTMRQLSRTEKQLLSIYAVFNQMDKSGATGDLRKTIESFANQSRVMAESWNDILTYSGLIVTRTLQQYGVMQKINAVLIFASRVLEAIAGSIEDEYAVQGDVFGDITDSALGATEATEELKSALLDFDKFQALNTSNEENAFGIDETLINAIDRYNSILSNADFEAAKLADDWIKKLGGIENITKKIKDFFDDIQDSNAFKLIGEMYETFVKLGDVLGDDIYYWIKSINKEIDNDIFGTFFSIWKWFNDNILTEETLAGLDQLLQWFIDWNEEANNAKTPWDRLVILFERLTELLDELGFDDMWSDIKKTWFEGGILGFADGGLPDKGSVFVAGEAGAELVTNMGSGQSGVMNMKQLENAVARGMIVGLSTIDINDDRPIYISIDGQRFFTASREIYRRNGYDVSAIN